MEEISMENLDPEEDLLIVDATECPVSHPVVSWIQQSLYSGYKKKTTLKYEVTISEETLCPVNWNGPFAGPTADITIF